VVYYSRSSKLVIVNDILLGCLLEFLLHLIDLVLVNSYFLCFEDWSLDESEVVIISESSEEPDERLLVLVVALGRDIVILKVLLSVEGDLFGLYFSVFHVDLVSNEHHWDVWAHSGQVLVPLWHVLVSDSGAHIKHNDSAMSANTIMIHILI
jgi:hypothetical protein